VISPPPPTSHRSSSPRTPLIVAPYRSVDLAASPIFSSCPMARSRALPAGPSRFAFSFAYLFFVALPSKPPEPDQARIFELLWRFPTQILLLSFFPDLPLPAHPAFFQRTKDLLTLLLVRSQPVCKSSFLVPLPAKKFLLLSVASFLTPSP